MNDVFVVQRVWQMKASGATTVAAQLCLRLRQLNLNDTCRGTRWGRKVQLKPQSTTSRTSCGACWIH